MLSYINLYVKPTSSTWIINKHYTDSLPTVFCVLITAFF